MKILSRFLFFFFSFLLFSCQSEDEKKREQYYTEGKILYQKYCQDCHQENGRGVGGLYSELSPRTVTNWQAMICLVKNGKTGKASKMPENKQLTSLEVTEICNFVTQEFANTTSLISIKEIENILLTCQNHE